MTTALIQLTNDAKTGGAVDAAATSEVPTAASGMSNTGNNKHHAIKLHQRFKPATGDGRICNSTKNIVQFQCGIAEFLRRELLIPPKQNIPESK